MFSQGVLLTCFAYCAFCQEFEVVSVKPNNSLSGYSSVKPDEDLFQATNVSLRSLVVRAYGVKDYQVEGPDWLASEHFDIIAKLPEGLPKDQDQYAAVMRAMMQNMLLDRFKLRMHREQKTFSVYATIIGKSGIRFKEALDCHSHTINSRSAHFSSTCVSMGAFTEFLSNQKDLPWDRPVVDMTGLKGFYNLELDWIPENRDSADKSAGGDLVSDKHYASHSKTNWVSGSNPAKPRSKS